MLRTYRVVIARALEVIAVLSCSIAATVVSVLVTTLHAKRQHSLHLLSHALDMLHSVIYA